MRIQVVPGNQVTITASQADALAFAQRPGRVWPASDLTHLESFQVVVDANGDLVDFEGEDRDDPVSSDELSAFIEYALWEAHSQIDELLTIEERKRAGSEHR